MISAMEKMEQEMMRREFGGRKVSSKSPAKVLHEQNSWERGHQARVLRQG
jgi:hypothetical protein